MKKLLSLIAVIVFIFAGGLALTACGKKEYSIIVESCEHGTINVDSKAKAGELVYFDAVPENGYELTKITVNNKVIAENHFEMPAKDVVLRATFERKYSITFTQSEHGTITLLTTNYKGGDLVEFSATPESGYVLYNFDANVNIGFNFGLSNLTYSFTMPNFDVVITPHFEKVYSITVDNNIQHGSIRVQDTAIADALVTLTIQPENNYALQQLTINGVNYYAINNMCEFTMPASNVVISATFVLIEENKSFSITVVQPNNGSISVNKTSAKYNENVIVTLTPNIGYDIKQFLINNLPIEINNNPFTFPMPNHDITISAEFIKIGYSITNYNAISIENVNSDYHYDEVYYKNNFISLDGEELICGYYDSEKYRVETLSYQVENNQIILDTDDPYLSQLTITMENGKLIVSNDDVALKYEMVEDFNTPHGIYSSPEEINGDTVDLEYVFQENGNIISIANVEYDIPGRDIGKANIYGNIMIIENVGYNGANYDVYVGRLSKNQEQGFSWDFYNFYYSSDYQYFHDQKPFTYKSTFDETTYTYNNETISEYPEEKDKFVRLTGNLVTFGAYVCQTLDEYGFYEGYLFLEYLPATIEGNNISVNISIPFSEKRFVFTITAQLSEDKQTLTVNFLEEEFVFNLAQNINFTSGTYKRSESYDSTTKIITDVIDEFGIVTETIKYENDDNVSQPQFIGRLRIFGNIGILICPYPNIGTFVGQITNNNTSWSGVNFYISSYDSSFQTAEFSYEYTKIV